MITFALSAPEGVALLVALLLLVVGLFFWRKLNNKYDKQ